MAKIPFASEALKSLFKSPVTEKYPHTPAKVAEGYRGRIKFNPETCVGCGMCIRVCAPEAIVKTVKPVEDGQEITLTFDLGCCTYCGFCADFCGRNSIELTKDYKLAVTDKNDLIESGTFFKKAPPKKPVPPKAAAPAAESKPAEKKAEAKVETKVEEKSENNTSESKKAE